MLRRASVLDMGVRGAGRRQAWDLPGGGSSTSQQRRTPLEVASLRHSRSLLTRSGPHALAQLSVLS